MAKSTAYAKRVKVYLLSQAANPPPLVFTDVKDILFDSTIRYDDSFFVHLDRIVLAEAWLNRDRIMIDQLRALGIEKGKPFAPDASTRRALAAGQRSCRAARQVVIRAHSIERQRRSARQRCARSSHSLHHLPRHPQDEPRHFQRARSHRPPLNHWLAPMGRLASYFAGLTRSTLCVRNVTTLHPTAGRRRESGSASV